jgi:hypothetical protein
VAAIIVALAAGGYFVGHSTAGSKKAAPSGGGISVEHATVAIPAGWRELKKVPKIPYLPLREAVGTAPAGAKSGLAMGMATLTYPWLLPNKLLAHEVAQPKTSYNSRADIVDIGGHQVRRTSGVGFAKSGKPLYTFLYLPQGKSSTYMAVCYSKTGSVTDLLNCEKVASQIKISGAKKYDLVPSASYASGLSGALSSLSKSQSGADAALKKAKTPGAQATAARQMASAYSTGATKVKKLKPTAYAQPQNQKIYRSLVTAGGAWRTLASAAQAKSSSQYAAASKKIASAENAVGAAISQLDDLGYAVG